MFLLVGDIYFSEKIRDILKIYIIVNRHKFREICYEKITTIIIFNDFLF